MMLQPAAGPMLLGVPRNHSFIDLASLSRLGRGPKWLIQRRRLHQAAERLRFRAAPLDLAVAAAALGYADQAHNRSGTHTGMSVAILASRHRCRHEISKE